MTLKFSSLCAFSGSYSNIPTFQFCIFTVSTFGVIRTKYTGWRISVHLQQSLVPVWSPSPPSVTVVLSAALSYVRSTICSPIS